MSARGNQRVIRESTAGDFVRCVIVSRFPPSHRLAIAEVVVPAANKRVIEALIEYFRQVIIEAPAPFAERLTIVKAIVVGDTLSSRGAGQSRVGAGYWGLGCLGVVGRVMRLPTRGAVDSLDVV